MIAKTNFKRVRQDAALAELSAEQDALLPIGRQTTYSQRQIASRIGLTRPRVEQLERRAKLRLVRLLAVESPESFLELGGTAKQLAFLRSISITSTNVRRLWRQWCDLDLPTGRGEEMS